MSKDARVLIVSAFGREHWLAVQLARKGFSVQLVDVTKQLGPWTPADYEGPFGFFRSAFWTDSYLERLKQEGVTQEQSNGFTIWLKNGPIELRSPLTNHRLRALGQSENTQKYVQNHDGYSDLQKKETATRLKALSFSVKWFAKFAHYFMANNIIPTVDHNDDYFIRPHLCPALDQYFLRNLSADTIEKSLLWCESQGVIVVRDAKIPDVALTGSNIDGLEIQAEKSGFVKASQYVWGLSSLETQFACAKVFKKIFSDVIEPDLLWQRFRIKLPQSKERDLLPNSFLLIDDLEFPWTHDNFILVRKLSGGEEFDAWILLPYSQRFQKKSLEEYAEKIMQKFYQRLALFRPTLESLPLEAELSSKELGGALFPVYSSKSLNAQFTKKFQNLYFDSVEQWPLLSWQGAFLGQNQIVDKINKWWSYLAPHNREKELTP
jgi:hypothetical protein